MRAEVKNPPAECVYFKTSTIDITATIELSFEVPSAGFDTERLKAQLTRERYGWLRGASINLPRLAYALGMESTKFIEVCTRPNVDITRINITKFNEQGEVIHEEDKVR